MYNAKLRSTSWLTPHLLIPGALKFAEGALQKSFDIQRIPESKNAIPILA
jgi:hypothetical protein